MTPTLKQYLNLQELEAAAAEVLSPAAFAYYRGGANDEHTLQANRDGYAQLKLRPRMLVDVSNVDTSTEVLGVPQIGASNTSSRVPEKASQSTERSIRGSARIPPGRVRV